MIKRRWLLRFFLWGVVVLLAKVFFSIVTEYRRYFPADFESNFLSGRRYTFSGIYRDAFYVHILSSPLALMIATYLLVSGGRPGQRRWHRIAGRIQLFLVLSVVVPSGMVMAMDAYAGAVSGAGFAVLNVLVSVTLVVAVIRARARKFPSHRQWATRCFLLLASPLLLRLIAGFNIVAGLESANSYRLNSWISWLIPLLGYEIFLAIRKRKHSDEVALVVDQTS